MVITSDKCFMVAIVAYIVCVIAVCIQQKIKKLWQILVVGIVLVVMLIIGAAVGDAPDLISSGSIKWYWLVLDGVLMLISVFAIFYSYHLYTIGM